MMDQCFACRYKQQPALGLRFFHCCWIDHIDRANNSSVLSSSGKSYLAKMLRSMGYLRLVWLPTLWLEESDVSKPSCSVRGKQPVMKKVMECCYEPEMEEVIQEVSKSYRCF